ncbi:TPA: HNH endonuclease [Klebsiella pneumoniae]|uniref:HNH endonuclease n=1 Tax=Klebsiella pneumoniae TaxID=573 RepID=UPI00103539DF|nr:HNH endonuclease [Klebsiella pneumoniae]HCB0083167.1 HNH endonuclease [Klebsiella pneumoniae]HCB1174760.1 HNH endonuclease [Klebsiella pneumoniae]HDZ3005561.1 HNH endonuclease [Klebsiella pneumoniae]
MINSNELRALLTYDKDTGVFRRNTSSGGQEIGSIAGTISKHGYIRIRIKNKAYFAHRLAWLYEYGVWPENEIDHINGEKSDNRLINLREASRSGNNHNKKHQKNSASGVKGVSWSKKDKRWHARCRANKQTVYFGSFMDLEEAMLAVIKAREKYHGKFANNEIVNINTLQEKSCQK